MPVYKLSTSVFYSYKIMSDTNDDRLNDNESDTIDSHVHELNAGLVVAEKQPPYSVFQLWEVWTIVCMGALSALFR